jgi:hypothetical protein
MTSTILVRVGAGAGFAQETTEGTSCVTVARAGADLATFAGGRYKVGIYTTAVYVARRRQRDGVLTWRRQGGYKADRTSGFGITPPMRQLAKERAVERGCKYVEGVRHGQVCD